MLKIVSENFIHALLLFLGLFLKISRWVPLIRGDRCGELAVSEGSTVITVNLIYVSLALLFGIIWTKI